MTEYEVAVIYDENADAGIELTRYASKEAAIRYAHGCAFEGLAVSVTDVSDGAEIFRSHALPPGASYCP